MDSIFAAFFWDPNPEAFTIPLIQRPIMWYGICFVVGFLVGYFILIPMLARRFSSLRYLLPRDVESWPNLFKMIQNRARIQDPHLAIIKKNLPEGSKKELDKLEPPYEGSGSLKNAVIRACTETMQEENLDRLHMQTLFPKGLYTVRDLGAFLSDRLLWYVVIGTIVGARLGHVLFYDLPKYASHPLDILKVWEGGLASHGGTLGVMLAIFLYIRSIRKNYPEIGFISFLDLIVVPTAFVAFCIRMGNFINQEILGLPSQLPWAVIFGHPADGSAPLARHPVQLYEAFVYLAIFAVLYRLWKTKGEMLRTGFLSGWFFILVFGSRFLIEFLKAPQSLLIDESSISMGQYLSLPFVVLGCYLLFFSKKSSSPNKRWV